MAETATEPKTIPPAVFKNGREVINGLVAAYNVAMQSAEKYVQQTRPIT